MVAHLSIEWVRSLFLSTNCKGLLVDGCDDNILLFSSACKHVDLIDFVHTGMVRLHKKIIRN